MDGGQFEDALNICALSRSSASVRDVNVELIHEKYALSLFQKGDFDGCVSHYIAGKSNVVAVLMLFPDLVPVVLQTVYASITRAVRAQSTGSVRGAGSGIGTPSGWGQMNKLTGLVMNRAAAALASYCEYHRAGVCSYDEIVALILIFTYSCIYYCLLFLQISKIADRAERLRGAGIGATMAPGLDDEVSYLSSYCCCYICCYICCYYYSH